MIEFLVALLKNPEFWVMLMKWLKKDDREGCKDAYKKAKETRDPKHISDFVNNVPK